MTLDTAEAGLPSDRGAALAPPLPLTAYQRLDEFLVRYLHSPSPRLTLRFEALEALVGEKLPKAARASVDWWYDDGRPDAPSLHAGQWRVEAVYLRAGIVTFRRRL